jgi:hypothetical protein
MHKTIRRANSITLHDWGLEMRIGKAAPPGTPVGTMWGSRPGQDKAYLDQVPPLPAGYLFELTQREQRAQLRALRARERKRKLARRKSSTRRRS